MFLLPPVTALCVRVGVRARARVSNKLQSLKSNSCYIYNRGREVSPYMFAALLLLLRVPVFCVVTAPGTTWANI